MRDVAPTQLQELAQAVVRELGLTSAWSRMIVSGPRLRAGT